MTNAESTKDFEDSVVLRNFIATEISMLPEISSDFSIWFFCGHEGYPHNPHNSQMVDVGLDKLNLLAEAAWWVERGGDGKGKNKQMPTVISVALAPTTCPICHKTFTRRYSTKRHLQTHLKTDQPIK